MHGVVSTGISIDQNRLIMCKKKTCIFTSLSASLQSTIKVFLDQTGTFLLQTICGKKEKMHLSPLLSMIRTNTIVIALQYTIPQI